MIPAQRARDWSPIDARNSIEATVHCAWRELIPTAVGRGAMRAIGVQQMPIETFAGQRESVASATPASILNQSCHYWISDVLEPSGLRSFYENRECHRQAFFPRASQLGATLSAWLRDSDKPGNAQLDKRHPVRPLKRKWS